MDATASRILDVYSTPRGEKRADVENTRKTENRCNRCWKDGGDVKRGGRGEVGTDEVEKGTEGNEENRRQREREREGGARRREGRRRRRKRIRIFTNHSARHLREGKSPLPLKSEEVERFIESWNT